MKIHTDADAVRFHSGNDRICDWAHPDEKAGLHKHVVETYGAEGVLICVCCLNLRAVRAEDFGQTYMLPSAHGVAR